MTDRPPHATLLERLAQGAVVCAEGYLFELERRGYVQAGPFVPQVVLEHPAVVEQLHREFVRAGSDVVEAFTYYGHREKLRVIGKEDLLEPLNRGALELAGRVARETGTLFAGNTCNTNVFRPGDAESRREVRAMFAEQVGWAAEAGADFVIAETFPFVEEAELALEVVRDAGLPAVVTLIVFAEPETLDGVPVAEACRRLEAAGADVVGLNCGRGPATMLPLLREIRAAVSVPVAGLPVPYRTSEAEPSFISLTDPGRPGPPHGRPFPTALDPFTCNRYEVAEFGREALALGVSYLGLCCGAGPHHVRSLAEAIGRRPPASELSPDMSRHGTLGTDPAVRRPTELRYERL